MLRYKRCLAASLQYVFIIGIWMYMKLDYFIYALLEVTHKHKKTKAVRDTLAGEWLGTNWCYWVVG